jgi:hypothetical protein
VSTCRQERTFPAGVLQSSELFDRSLTCAPRFCENFRRRHIGRAAYVIRSQPYRPSARRGCPSAFPASWLCPRRLMLGFGIQLVSSEDDVCRDVEQEQQDDYGTQRAISLVVVAKSRDVDGKADRRRYPKQRGDDGTRGYPTPFQIGPVRGTNAPQRWTSRSRSSLKVPAFW